MGSLTLGVVTTADSAASADPAAAFAALADETYVLLTTFRRSGVPVATPVWAAWHDGTLLVTTGPSTGKVKRIRNNSSVLLSPCTVSGAVDEGAPSITAVAEIATDDASLADLDAALDAKYGLKYRAIRAAGKIRRQTEPSVCIRLVPATEPTAGSTTA